MSAEKALLLEVAARANNIIMKGSFSGDDITEAADLMKICLQICESIQNEEKANKRTASKS